MGILKDFDTQEDENKNEGGCDNMSRDCVGRVGHCPLVTAVEDCTTFVMSKDQKKLADIKEEDNGTNAANTIADALIFLLKEVEEIKEILKRGNNVSQ